MDARLKSMPQDYLERLAKIIPPGRLKSVHDALLTRLPEIFRINTLRADEDTVLNVLRQDNVAIEKLPLPQCFAFKNISHKKIEALSCYQNGWIYLQNLSSQLPALALAPVAGQSVLDLCAAPGGKTAHICALMHNQGSVTAIEPDLLRYKRLVHNLTVLGAFAETQHTTGESYLNRHKENIFDCILVDAPCSGDGTFKQAQRAGYSHWSVEFVRTMAKLQKKLLALSWQNLKPGGRLVYSTCSLSPEENEEVVHDFLLSHKSAKIMPFLPPNPLKFFFYPPLASWNTVFFDKSIKNANRILPGPITEGFFFVILEKCL